MGRPLRVHWLQHVPFEGLGAIEPWLAARGARVTATRFHEDGALPAIGDLGWLIVMGGPMSVNDEGRHPWLAAEKRFIAEAIDAGRTVLGLCLGAQLIASARGAAVRAGNREIGWFEVARAGGADGPAFGLPAAPLDVLQWHGETFDLPRGAVHLFRSDACEHQAFSLGDRVLAMQFHLEMTPGTIAALGEHCGRDLAPGRWVQPVPEMLADPARFERSHQALHAVLDRLAGAGSAAA